MREMVRLGDVAQINPRFDKTSLADDTPVSFVPMAAVGAADGQIDASNARPFGEVKKGYTPFRDGDVLFAKVTPCMENGKMAVARGLKNGVGFGSSEFHVLRPTERVDAKYLYHFVSSESFRKEAARHMTGAVGLRRVPSAFLADAKLPLVDLDEQRSIVAEIDKQFSRLDEAVANLQRVKANLKRYKAAILKAAVEGRLVETEASIACREGRRYETGDQLLVRILKARRSEWKGRGRYKHPAVDARGELNVLPEGWARASVEALSSLLEYGTSAKTDAHPSGVPVLRMGNISDGGLKFDALKYLPSDHDEFPKLFVEPGDLLFNRTNSPELVGKTAVFRPRFSQAVSFASYLIRVRLVKDGVLPEFVAAYINSSFGRHWVKSVVTQQVGQANVNGTKLQSLMIPLPPAAEQHRIVTELELRHSILREVEAEVDANLQRAAGLRQSSLRRAFTSIT